MLFPLIMLGSAALAVVFHLAGTKPKLSVGAVPVAPPGLVFNPGTGAWERPHRVAAYPGYGVPAGWPPGGVNPAIQPPTGYGNPGTAMFALTQLVVAGGQPPPILIQQALAEAQAAGDQAAVGLLLGMLVPQPVYPPQPTYPPVPLAVGGDPGIQTETVDPSDPDSPDTWGELANPSQFTGNLPAAPTPTQAPMAPPTTPIPGVAPDQWQRLVGQLRTRAPAWGNDNHCGQFEHHRRRLRQLGLPDRSTSPDDQYRALCADLGNYHATQQDLIQRFVGQPVDLGGQPVAVSLSGILGLLKAAGPQGAAGWLSDPQDRQRFPGTTEVFQRTNGCF